MPLVVPQKFFRALATLVAMSSAGSALREVGAHRTASPYFGTRTRSGKAKYKSFGVYATFWGVAMKEAANTNWVLISKVVELTGYTDDAIRAKKKRGEWVQGKHWRKAPDNRVVFDLMAINRWMGGHHA